MGLAIALNNALSGLNISQQALGVLSQNIANANTAGYSRQIISQEARYLDGQGAGVSLSDVSRKVDEFLIKSQRLQNAAVGKANVVSDYFDRTQLLLGNPGAGNSLDSYMNTFFGGLQSLGQNPESTTLRVNAVNTGSNMAQQIRQLSSSLNDLRFQADQDIAVAIRAVNKDIVDLKGLNATISENTILGKSVADLLDRRDATLKDIAQYMDISTYLTSDNQVNVFTAAGTALLDQDVYQLSYSAAGSVDTLANNTPLSAILLYRTDINGNNPTGTPITIATSAPSPSVTTILTSGQIRGLLDMRDNKLPKLLEQLDTLAAKLRDQVNQIHNAGTGFPGASSLTGERAVLGEDFSQWAGAVRIAVLGADGKPVPSAYDDETSGARPLTLDLSTLNTGNGAGKPSVEGIIDEINRYFGVPQNKVTLGNLNNIQLASDTTTLPGSPPQFSFDFDLENISAHDTNFFVTGVQVLDNNNVDITSVTTNVPQVALAAAGTYVTTAGSQTVTVNTTAAHGFSNGQKIFLSTPSGAVDGIPAGSLGGYFTVANVTATSFDIVADTAATAGGSFNEASQTATPSYATSEAGTAARTTADGALTVDLSGNSAAPFYTVKVTVGVDDATGGTKTAVLTYRVESSQSGLLNKRYAVQNVTGQGSLVLPNTSQPLAHAMLVDAQGNELPRFNGQYTTIERGYLKIAATGSNVIAIDSLDSAEQGKPNGDPPVTGTDRGFSYYFELNNFFKSLPPSEDGDDITGAAAALEVEARLLAAPNLISLGGLTQSPRPTDPSQPPLYTYERTIGDNGIIQQLARLSNASVTFPAAGNLGQTSLSFTGYAGALIGSASTDASIAKNDKTNAQALIDGYAQRSDSVSGVNLDEELANTVIYQNAYTASARIITVVNSLFDALLNSFQGR